MESNDPRATIIRNVGEDQEVLENVLKQIPPLQKLTFDKLIEIFDKCFQVRQEPEFIDAVFSKKEIYNQFIGWILTPLRMIQKKQSSNQKTVPLYIQKKYPYVCMCIAKGNPSFYESLYISAYFDQNFIWSWFSFLKDGQCESFQTSLGYFMQIMLPFIKYEFSQSSKICDILSNEVTIDLLASSSQYAREETPVQKQRQQLSNEKKRCFYEDQISLLRIFSDDLLSTIINYIEYEGIFKFLHNLVLISLDQNDLKRSKRIFQQYLKKALNTRYSSELSIEKIQKSPIMDICNQYILQILNEIYQNANTQKNYRVIFFIDSMIRQQLIPTYIDRIQNSFLIIKQNQQQKSSITSSTDFSGIIAQEECLEYYLKSLSVLMKIYSKMVKNKKSEEDLLRQSKFYYNDSDDEITGQNKVMKQFLSQIQIIFQKLPNLSYLVKKSQLRTILFSSGQNIKPITLCKYEFFQLIYNCLILAREYSDDFVVDTQKINIFSIVEKYLTENRWNNLAHKTLEKIAYLLIANNKNFFKTKQMNKNNIADQFLNSIIESFTNKNYIFLNSFRFTTQGNIHTLYIIAKAIIYQLQQSQKLPNFIHQFDYYKKFVLTDLQSYEEKTFSFSYPMIQQQLNSSEKKQESDFLDLSVDELPIKEIVRKIDVINKWSIKQNRKRRGSAIHRSFSSMADDVIGFFPEKPRNLHPSECFLIDKSDPDTKTQSLCLPKTAQQMKSESQKVESPPKLYLKKSHSFLLESDEMFESGLLKPQSEWAFQIDIPSPNSFKKLSKQDQIQPNLLKTQQTLQ